MGYHLTGCLFYALIVGMPDGMGNGCYPFFQNRYGLELSMAL